MNNKFKIFEGKQYHQSALSITGKALPMLRNSSQLSHHSRKLLLSWAGIWHLGLCILCIWQEQGKQAKRDPNPEAVLLAGRGERTLHKAFPTYHFLLCPCHCSEWDSLEHPSSYPLPLVLIFPSHQWQGTFSYTFTQSLKPFKDRDILKECLCSCTCCNSY